MATNFLKETGLVKNSKIALKDMEKVQGLIQLYDFVHENADGDNWDDTKYDEIYKFLDLTAFPQKTALIQQIMDEIGDLSNLNAEISGFGNPQEEEEEEELASLERERDKTYKGVLKRMKNLAK